MGMSIQEVQSCWGLATTPFRPGGVRWGCCDCAGCTPVALLPRRCTLVAGLWCMICSGVPVRLEITMCGSSLSTCNRTFQCDVACQRPCCPDVVPYVPNCDACSKVGCQCSWRSQRVARVSAATRHAFAARNAEYIIEPSELMLANAVQATTA